MDKVSTNGLRHSAAYGTVAPFGAVTVPLDIKLTKYEINPSSGTVRPDGGDYFKKITFNLSNIKKLCICAEDSETDGYCNIWTE